MQENQCRRTIKSRIISIQRGEAVDALSLLQSEARSDNLKDGAVLLAHLYDGVLWGKSDNGDLIQTPEFAGYTPPKLRENALMEARLFSPACELHVWRNEGPGRGYRYRRVTIVTKAEAEAGDSNQADYISEHYLLWGTHAKASADGFTLLEHGAEGMLHAPPIAMPQNLKPGSEIEAPQLEVEHYLAAKPCPSQANQSNASHMARIAFTRLVQLLPLEGVG